MVSSLLDNLVCDNTSMDQFIDIIKQLSRAHLHKQDTKTVYIHLGRVLLGVVDLWSTVERITRAYGGGVANKICRAIVRELGFIAVTRLLEQNICTADISVDDGVRVCQVEVVECSSHIGANGDELPSCEGISLFQDTLKAGWHELSEDDGVVVHRGTNKLEEVWVPGASSHVHLSCKEANVMR